MIAEKNLRILNNEEPLTVMHAKYETKISDSSVKHYNTYKISILLSDGLVAVMDNKVLNTKKMSILFFRPDEFHFGRFIKSGTHEYLDIYIPLSFFNSFSEGENITSFLEDRSDRRINHITFSPEEQLMLNDVTQKIISLLPERSPTANAELFHHIFHIILMCAKHYEKQKDSPTEELPAYISKTFAYILEHYNENFSLKDVASEIGCSVVYISRLFKSYTGDTIYNHLTNVRIKKAQELLINGASVTEACFAVGFNDCSNFIRTFKKLVGQTPFEYKKYTSGI